MARRVSARGFVPPKPGSDKETLHLIEMEDPSGRGGGYHSGKYDPSTGDFGAISLEKMKSEGRWTILFFYPADFTFV